MFTAVKAILNETLYIPPPTLTEKNLPSQAGKVFIITGGYNGIGLSLVKILYQNAGNSTIYIAGRSQNKFDEALKFLRATYPSSTPRVKFLQLDLSDLSTIRNSAEEFMAKELRLDVLTNNAGLMNPPGTPIAKTPQGIETQMGINTVGALLFTQCLLPVLRKTVALVGKGNVRVTWPSTIWVYPNAPKGGIEWDEEGKPRIFAKDVVDYAQSKAGVLFLTTEAARRWRGDGIVSVSFNPGNLKTKIYEGMSLVQKIMVNPIMHNAIKGAYTELYAGWAPDITLENSGAYLIPWGRIGKLRADIEDAARDVEGSNARRFWDWCERQIDGF